jgi:YjbE family integral membrane protein
MDFSSPEFWIALGQIIMIDILLGGDNAVVIALASRRLPDAQRKQAIFWGMFGAVALRVVLIFFALQLLKVPFLKIVGGVLLLYIGIKLLLPQHDGDGHDIDASTHLFGAVKTIILADAVMSVDNVIGIAGAAKDHLGLVIFGLLFSIPIIIWGSRFVLTLMDRFPLVIVFGAALLGWIGGGMIVDDVVLKDWATPFGAPLHYAAAAAGALFVVAVGKLLARRVPAPPTHAPPVDLAAPRDADAPKPPSDPS